MLNADVPPIFFRLDPGWQIGVADSKEGKTVQVGDFQIVFLKIFFNAGQICCLEIGRIKMGPVSHNFDTAKTQIRDFFQRFKKREFNKSVGGVAEYHVSFLETFEKNSFLPNFCVRLKF